MKTLVIFFGRVSQRWVEERVKCAVQFVARQLASENSPTLEACWVYLLPPEKDKISFGPGMFKIGVLDNSRSDQIEPEVASLLFEAATEGGGA